MKMGRREALQFGSAAVIGLALTGCESLEQRFTKPLLPTVPWLPLSLASPESRLLNRIGFGPSPSDLADVRKMGISRYITEQLAPDSIKEPDILTYRIGSIGDVLTADAGILFDIDDRVLVATLRQATTLRAVYSRKQLYERMVAFWTDHFNIYEGKGSGPQLKIIDDRETIRKHAFGRFRDLLGASARSAAMLGYLDNGINRKGHANENYAREVMELHTLGVDGGYTQHDVQEVARCLTGWTTAAHWHRSAFYFAPDLHDNGQKTVLGVIFPPGGGVHDGDRVLDMLAAHPATARHLARKLCHYFLGDTPEKETSEVAEAFLRTDGDIKAALNPILNSPLLLTGAPIYKRPFDYVVSALRAVNADTDGGTGIQGALEQLGQPLFGWPRPDGFPDKTAPWMGNMLGRWNFALNLTGNQILNSTVTIEPLVNAAAQPGSNPRVALAELILGGDGERARAYLSAIEGSRTLPETAALLLMSPPFQYR